MTEGLWRAVTATASKIQVLAGIGVLLAAGLPLIATAVRAAEPPVQNIETIQLPPVTELAPAAVSDVRCHVLPFHKPGQSAPGSIVRPSCDQAGSIAAAPESNVASPIGPSSQDCAGSSGCAVMNYNGGSVVTSSQQTFIYLNTTAGALGNPAGFINDFFASTFIHVMDQYMKPSVLKTSGRYTSNSTALSVSQTEPHTLLDSQVQTIILNAVKAHFPSGGGGGYNVMYSLMLPSGQDLCFNDGSSCYCPDNDNSCLLKWSANEGGFCAYHSSFNGTDAVGNSIHIIYQAMPFQDVTTQYGGCQIPDGPNGPSVDSTNSVFSHELSETITDPDPNSGWTRNSDGYEIGDICAWSSMANPIYLNGHAYEIQMEYSNAAVGCVGFFPNLASSHAFAGFISGGTDSFGADVYSTNFSSDIFWRNTSGTTALWLMNGGQILQSGGLGTVPTTWSVVGQRDFNGDGNADLLWRDSSGNTAVWLMNGTTVSSSVGLGNVPTTWSVVGTGDLNGDGQGDLLWRDSSGNTAIWFMSGGTVSSTASLGNISTAWTVVGDDNNGNILWHDTSGNYAIWHVNGSTVTATAGLGNVPLATWHVAGIGDFNGDGLTDIIWRDTSGNTSIWFLNSSLGVQSTGYVGNIGTTWTVAQTGDYNNDGRSDLVWVDTSGNVSMWFMNGATVTSTAGLGNVGTTWSAQALNAE